MRAMYDVCLIMCVVGELFDVGIVSVLNTSNLPPPNQTLKSPTVIISSGTTTPSLSRGASGSDLGTLSAMSASKAKLSLLLPSHHDGAPFPPNRHHDGLPVSPTFRRPAARVGLGDKEEEEQQQQGACDRAPTVENSEQPQQQPQQQPAAASPGEGEGSSETGAAGGQQQPSHAQSPAAAVEIFTHDEIVCLRLIFALFDDNGDDFVDEGELLRYAEETGAWVGGWVVRMFEAQVLT